MNLSGNDKNKITGKKYQPVMSVTGLNDQGLNNARKVHISKKMLQNCTMQEQFLNQFALLIQILTCIVWFKKFAPSEVFALYKSHTH